MISDEELQELKVRNQQTWKQWDEVMRIQKEAIADALDVEWTEEEWEKFRESHKNPNNC